MEKDTKNKKKEREVTHIELIWEDQEDLINLRDSEEFSTFILEKSYEAISKAIEDNLETVDLFNIFNMSLIVELDKSNYKPVLERIRDLYQESEAYEECAKITKLIDKL
jgi:RNA processing factor Prp31